MLRMSEVWPRMLVRALLKSSATVRLSCNAQSSFCFCAKLASTAWPAAARGAGIAVPTWLEAVEAVGDARMVLTPKNCRRKDFCPSLANGQTEHWKLAVHGAEVDTRDLLGLLRGEADEYPDLPENGKKLSSRRLLVRSDGGAPYGLVQQVIESAASVGMYRLELAATKPRG